MTRQPKELDAVIDAETQEAMKTDPELAQVIASFLELAKLAHELVKNGKFATHDDAMEALTGQRPRAAEDMGKDVRLFQMPAPGDPTEGNA